MYAHVVIVRSNMQTQEDISTISLDSRAILIYFRTHTCVFQIDAKSS